MAFWILMPIIMQFHKDAVLYGKEFILQYDDPDTCRRIDGFIDKQLQESASFNKLALRSIVECVMFCGKQGISFRGHRDDASLVPRPRFPTAAGGLHHRYVVAVM